LKTDSENFAEFLRSGRAFSIPVFQRNYDWGKKHCQKLFQDIEDAVGSNTGHFIGTIVLVKSPNSIGRWNEYFVIDGQQRIASVMLLLKAIHDHPNLDKNDKNMIWEDYLTNKHAPLDKFRLKLKPIESDSKAWESIINGDNIDGSSSNLTRNYNTFKGWIGSSKKTPKELLEAIESLWVISLELDQNREKPQVIFESINSTGKELTKGDLIRNYLLMDAGSPDIQTRFYHDYWIPIERYCDTKKGSKLTEFMRDYLTMNSCTLVNMEEVYEQFQSHAKIFQGNLEALLSELRRHAKYYSWFLGNSNDKDIKSLLAEFDGMKTTVAFCALLWFFDKCYHKETLPKKGLIKVMKTLLSYQYRRLVCGYKTNSLNRTYASLPREISDCEDIPSKLLEVLAGKTRTLQFPLNEDFRSDFITFGMYPKHAKYTLAMIENHLSPKEKVELNEQITVEHIMPRTITAAWKRDLGPEHKRIYDEWLHTIGNLTLTGSNPELSNHTFDKKKDTYADSKFELTRDAVRYVRQWDEKAIKKRAERMADWALDIWQLPKKYNYPLISNEIDYSYEHNIMDDVDVANERPDSYFFKNEEKPVKSWREMFVSLLGDLYDHDHTMYKDFIRHEVAQQKHLAEPVDSGHKFIKEPVEICPGYLTEINFSSRELMSFMQIAVQEIYGLQDEVRFTLKPKSE